MAKNKPVSQLHKPSSAALKRLVVNERYIKGGVKNYIDPTTNMLYSRRQVQQARAGGITNETAAAARKAMKALPKAAAVKPKLKKAGESLDNLLHMYQMREMMETGKLRSKQEILRDPKFWEAVDGLTSPRSTAPNGKKARALEEFGYRPRGAPWKVGQSPKRKKNGATTMQKAARKNRNRSKIK